MQSVFDLKNKIVKDYQNFSRSFSKIVSRDILEKVELAYEENRYWPDTMIQINPHYKKEGTIEDHVCNGILHSGCAKIFRYEDDNKETYPLTLYKHQAEAILLAQNNKSFIVTTGTGSGKSLTFFIPIVDRILKNKERGVKRKTSAIIIYPMNALANSQKEELKKYLGFVQGEAPFSFERYTSQEDEGERKNIAENPPDILLTNYMMLELILTRYDTELDRKIIENCKGLEFLVLDELHTYRGRQGADVAMLVRRIREHLGGPNMICIGTSATMKSRNMRDDNGITPEAAASKLFGVPITSGEVIGETLERVTDESLNIGKIKAQLAEDMKSKPRRWHKTGYDYEKFRSDPMSIWVELTLGINMTPDNLKNERAKPLDLREAIAKFAKDAQVSEEVADDILRDFLVSVQNIKTPLGKAPFAFKLHQFISGPGRVSCTLEPAGDRTVTLDEQIYAPLRKEDNIPLFYTYFCRECGQEYHPVRCNNDNFERREIDDVSSDEENVNYGFVAPKTEGQRFTGKEEELPDDWFDYNKDGTLKLKPTRKKRVPEEVLIDKYGKKDGFGSTPFWYMQGRFGYCVKCGAVHDFRGKDINRLVGLSGEGRSSATTILTLATMRELQKGNGKNNKILGFIDNRQDAALQAGHFNDFMFQLLLRAGLLGALKANGGRLSEGELPSAVFSALGFNKDEEKINTEYMRARHPNNKGRELAKTALCRVLGYRLLYDQYQGWRYNFPNLEQLKLIEIDYVDLESLCRDESAFRNCAETLGAYPPDVREKLYRLIFDRLRKQLCIDSPFLGRTEIDKTKHEATVHLVWPWSLEDDELTQSARTLSFEKIMLKGRQDTDFVFVGPRSALVREIKYKVFLDSSDIGDTVRGAKGDEILSIVKDAIDAAVKYGYLQSVPIEKGVVGYRLKPSCLEWKISGEKDKTVNQYFKELYEKTAESLGARNYDIFSLEAHEHTAQVDGDKRQALEQRFRYKEKDRQEWETNHSDEPFLPLPILYCSPTMELGVDISELDVVYMRNVPPTPANYAQRSGRAGRSGQAALIFAYCAAQSPHDQWYFHNRTEIVEGNVQPPVIDLTNKDLLDSHLLALWLSRVEYELGSRIAPLIELDDPARPLKSELREHCNSPKTHDEAFGLMNNMIKALSGELQNAPWYSEGYAERLVKEAPVKFNKAFDRWRDLLRATEQQRDKARTIMDGFSYSVQEKRDARARHDSAVNQINLLTSISDRGTSVSDFYIYRYLANQGFLPGYNFPRLPLMAWIPAGQGKGGAEREGRMVTRSRFLALSEFGPRSLLYHQGNTFRVVRAKLSAGAVNTDSVGAKLGTISARICTDCGYCHLGDSPSNPEPVQNVCEHCGKSLSDEGRMSDLYRIETVETVRVERITANDEERRRQGFELQTTYSGTQKDQEAEARYEDTLCASLSYSPSARIWRINKGWRRRKDKNQAGFFINPMSGYWSKEDSPDEAGDENTSEDAANKKARPQRIVPYVEDCKNMVTLKPEREFKDKNSLATIQAALETGMERFFQIESSELAVEPLPNAADRKVFLFYESAEGGAGVLQRLCNEKNTLSLIARQALKTMHYDVPDGRLSLDIVKEREKQNLECVAGCYNCLLSYYNQMEHKLIDRHDPEALEFLIALANSAVQPAAKKAESTTNGKNSSLSRWLAFLEASGCNMPDVLSKKIMGDRATIDAYYKDARGAVFMGGVSGEVRDYLESRGFRVLSFLGDENEWTDILQAAREIFYAKNIDNWGDDL
ncbi:RNA helicase [Synergistales bacterium]|nr:RNA helicase [Synergistales bacterium]